MAKVADLRPLDGHNLALLEHLRPPDWRNPKPADRYNLVVIGSGPAGLVAAAGAAGLGARVALVEKHLMGGDCLNVGCVPSKCLIHSSRVMGNLARAREMGMEISEAGEAQFSAAMERLRRLRARITERDSARRFTELGVDVFLGDGRFTSRDVFEVDGERLRFAKAAVCTGARPFVPSINGLSGIQYYTNETIFGLTARPARILFLGAGPIASELAQAFRRLGCEVAVVAKSEQFLPREDPDAAAILSGAFQREGIVMRLGAVVKRVYEDSVGKHVVLDSGGCEETLDADLLMVATGRSPNVEDLGLEAAGIEFDQRRGIQVDDRLRTTNSRVYSAGDVCMRYQFTHAADAAARLVIQNALFFGRKKLSALTIPWCTYTSPEIAHVGLYPQEAEEKGIEIDTWKVEVSEVDRAVCDGAEEGFVKIHTRKGKGEIVGATLVSSHAGDLISEIGVAMAGGIGLGGIARVIHPYPTQAEVIRKAGDLYNRSRLTPVVAGFLRRWLSWRR